jgi:hypothetical protein
MAMIDSTSPIPIRMTDRERTVFEALLRNAKSYLEFGCGGSTEIAVQSDVRQIVSVDSDVNWIRALQEKPLILSAVAQSSSA